MEVFPRSSSMENYRLDAYRHVQLQCAQSFKLVTHITQLCSNCPLYWHLSLCFQEFPLSGSWAERGPQRAGSRLRNRHCRRRRREGHSSTAEAFCGHDPHFDFRWGLGSLRADRCPHLVHEINTQHISTTRSVLYVAAGGKKCKTGKNCKNFCRTRWKKWRRGKNELKWPHEYGLISTMCTVVPIW